LVFFDRVCSGLETSKVMIDFYQGACQLMEHLIERGFRRIAHITGPVDVTGVQERLQAYRDVCRRHGLPLDERLIVPGGFLAENGVLAVERLLSLAQRPDAVFAVNDEVAIGAMIRLKEEGLQVPQDIAVAGFDNDKISAFTTPPLTTVDVPRVEIGKKSVELLLPYLQPSQTALEPVMVRLATQLVVRASTGRPSS